MASTAAARCPCVGCAHVETVSYTDQRVTMLGSRNGEDCALYAPDPHGLALVGPADRPWDSLQGAAWFAEHAAGPFEWTLTRRDSARLLAKLPDSIAT